MADSEEAPHVSIKRRVTQAREGVRRNGNPVLLEDSQYKAPPLEKKDNSEEVKTTHYMWKTRDEKPVLIRRVSNVQLPLLERDGCALEGKEAERIA